MKTEEKIKESLRRIKMLRLDEDFEIWYFKAYKEALEWVLEE